MGGQQVVLKSNPIKHMWHRMWYLIKMRRVHQHAKLAKKYLSSLDLTMKTMGMPRTQVRQFWRDFSKYENVRTNFLEVKD